LDVFGRGLAFLNVAACDDDGRGPEKDEGAGRFEAQAGIAASDDDGLALEGGRLYGRFTEELATDKACEERHVDRVLGGLPGFSRLIGVLYLEKE
jgi:hypothetical protein